MENTKVQLSNREVYDLLIHIKKPSEIAEKFTEYLEKTKKNCSVYSLDKLRKTKNLNASIKTLTILSNTGYIDMLDEDDYDIISKF